MSLLYIDGYCHSNPSRYSTGSLNPNDTLWAQTALARTPGGRYSAHKYIVNGISRAIPDTDEIFVGSGVRITVTNATLMTFFGDAYATTHIALRVTGSGYITVYRGATLLATGTTAIANDTWYYIEAHVVIDDVAGIVEVRINGSTTADISFTGDTKNGGTKSSICAVALACYNAFGGWWCYNADTYICDATGSINNTWLGDVTVKALAPTAAGNSTQLTPLSGSNYSNVNSIPYNDATYNSHATSGNEDTYAYADLLNTSVTVYGVQLSTRLAKSDAGAKSAKTMTRSGGTDYLSAASVSPGTGFSETLQLSELDPDTSSQWTATGVNAAQFGVKVD